MNNLSGRSFGHLTVLYPTRKRHPKTGEIYWQCSCECGRQTSYRSSRLTQGLRVTCGECRPQDRVPRSSTLKKVDRARQGKFPFSHLKTSSQLKLIKDFCFSGDYQELSDKYSVTYDTLRSGIKLFRERLNTMYELVYMANAEKTHLPAEVIERALKTDFTKEVLRDMLSGDTEETLTDHELMYCHVFMNTGSNITALAESQLDICLTEKTPVRLQYLGMHLRNKPNIAQYIKALQEERINEIDVHKKVVQKELITQIEQLREKIALAEQKGDRSNLIKCIELLGRTEAAFEDKVKVEGVSAASALDKFLEMAKEEVDGLPDSGKLPDKRAVVKEIPGGAAEETYYLPENTGGQQGEAPEDR